VEALGNCPVCPPPLNPALHGTGQWKSQIKYILADTLTGILFLSACPHGFICDAGSMQRRTSVCLSHRSTAATAAGGLAAERPADRKYRSIAAGTLSHAVVWALCCRRRHSAANTGHVESRRKRLNADLL